MPYVITDEQYTRLGDLLSGLPMKYGMPIYQVLNEAIPLNVLPGKQVTPLDIRPSEPRDGAEVMVNS